jgi:hypothetical protein
MLTADPDLLRVRPVNPVTFWGDLEKALDANPEVGVEDAPMRDLVWLRAGRRGDPQRHTFEMDRFELNILP